MRLQIAKKLANAASLDPAFNKSLMDFFDDICRQLNQVTEGTLEAITNKTATVPTTGDYQVGDFVKNSAPVELGAVNSKYVIDGWVCIDSDPLTFVQKRFLTGN